jgi:hypothetical protein
MKERSGQREEGQSLIIIAALLVVLIALIGLVVDAGNAYAQRRIVQNAVDAASLAGAQELARQDDWKLDPTDPGLLLYNYQVINAVERFAEVNRVDPDTLTIYYADIAGNILANAKEDLGTGTIIKEDTFGEVRAEAVLVEGSLPFPTYLVRVIGRNEMTARAKAKAHLACGACSAGDPDGGGLFPIAVHVGLFDADDGFPVYGKNYTLWEKDPHFPGTGSFGWLTWDGDPSNTTLVDNMEDTSRSGRWSVDDFITSATGVMKSNGVRQELANRINNQLNMKPSRPMTVTLPIFDYTEGTGSNLKYHIVGFANFRIECYHASRNQHFGPSCDFDPKDNGKWISGTFVKGLVPSAVAGCSDYGVCAAEITPPLEVKRVLKGRVTPWRVFVEKNATGGPPEPVDVMHVVDISGSMCSSWAGSGGSSPCTNTGRLATAKDVLTGFNRAVEDPTAPEFADLELGDWDPGDQNRVGLATYPTMQGTSSYYTDCYMELGNACKSGPTADCGKSNNTLYFANKDKNLTGDILSVNGVIDGLSANGGTSMPRGLQYGREMFGEVADIGNLQVMILTTDGMPNIKIDGEWTGYLGNYTRPPAIVSSGCNDSVYQAAVQQANQAKEQGIIVFTIGIQETIDVPLMQAIASADTHPDKPHFFLAKDEDDFEEIYRQILTRLPSLGSEECIADENAAQGSGATVYLYDKHGNLVDSTVAEATGDFRFDNVEPGTYQLRASWTDTSVSPSVIYDVMTWTLGGDATSDPIWVEIPLGKQETEKDLYLRTDHQFVCGE